MKANYEQKGDNWDYANPTEEVIEAGTLVVMGDVVGIAATRILPGEIGTVATTGVWSVPKDTSEIAAGEHVVYDAENDVATVLTVSEPITGDIGDDTLENAEVLSEAVQFIGVAVKDAATDAATVSVKLNI